MIKSLCTLHNDDYDSMDKTSCMNLLNTTTVLAVQIKYSTTASESRILFLSLQKQT